jgi:amino acid adenylation domain-containing protein
MTALPLVPHAIEHWSRAAPASPAIWHGVAGQRTYAELWADASAWKAAIERTLARVPHAPEPLVAVAVERSPVLPAIKLGAWLAGAGYVPIDPRLPAPRIAAIAATARPDALVAAEALAAVLGLEGMLVEPPDRSADRPADTSRCRPDGLAYVIYTSGSTGAPKGVEIEHGSLARLVADFGARMGVRPGVRTTMLANLGFDGLIMDEWGTLSGGATLCVPDAGVPGHVERVVDFINAAGATRAYLPTPAAEALLQHPAPPAGLATVLTGGDRLRLWPPEGFPAALLNSYGPTECTVYVTCSGDLRAERERAGLPAIGAAGRDVTLRLVAEGAPDAAEPEVGEVHVGGPLVGRGYRGDPRATAEKFVALDGDPARRWYRTGDICRRRPDGQLDFLRRDDDQFKVSGYRVEAGEIEFAVMACDGVREVVVVPVAAADGGTAMAAWIVGDADPDRARAHLLTQLPAYMVPATLRRVGAIPKTANGKADRAAIKAIENDPALSAGEREGLANAGSSPEWS